MQHYISLLLLFFLWPSFITFVLASKTKGRAKTSLPLWNLKFLKLDYAVDAFMPRLWKPLHKNAACLEALINQRRLTKVYICDSILRCRNSIISSNLETVNNLKKMRFISNPYIFDIIFVRFIIYNTFLIHSSKLIIISLCYKGI